MKIMSILLAVLLGLSSSAPAQPKSSLMESELSAAAQSLEEASRELHQWRAQMEVTAAEVRQAEQQVAHSRGFVAPLLSQERLRKSRQKHHENSRRVKEARRYLSLLVERIDAWRNEITTQMDNRVAQLNKDLEEGSPPSEAENLQKRLESLRQRQQRWGQSLEKHLGPYETLFVAEPLQQEPEEPFADESLAPPPPIPGPPSPLHFQDGKGPKGWREGPGSADRMRGWLFLKRHQENLEQMQRRIDMLEQEVQRMKNDLQQLKSQQDSSSEVKDS